MWFLRIAEELSVSLNSLVEDSPLVSSPYHNPDCVILLNKAFFCDSKPCLRYKIFNRKIWYAFLDENVKKTKNAAKNPFFRQLFSNFCHCRKII